MSTSGSTCPRGGGWRSWRPAPSPASRLSTWWPRPRRLFARSRGEPSRSIRVGAGAMILYLPVLVFLAGLALAHRRSRVQRLIGLLVMVAGGAGSLALVVEPAVAAGWALGPIAGVLLARPVGTRRRLAFEAL